MDLNVNWISMMREFLGVFWILIRELWYLWIIVLFIVLLEQLFYYLERWCKKRRAQKWLKEHKSLEEWKKLSGKEFEETVAAIFEKLGYKTKIKRNGGVDIIAGKDKKQFLIQCKQMEKVIPDDVRAFWGSIQDRVSKGKVEKGFFVTTGSFTEGSREFVKNENIRIKLIDGFDLEKLAKENKK